MGKVHEKPLVVDGEIKIRKVIKIVYTADHRIGDASLAVKGLSLIKQMIEHPESMETVKFDGHDLILASKDE